MTNPEATTTNTAAAVAQQGAQVAPEKAPSKKAASQKKGAAKGQKTAKGGAKGAPKKEAPASKPARAKGPHSPRAESKGAKVLGMIGRPTGATLAEITKATGWQTPSVRGFVSAVLGKKMGLKVKSSKSADGQRTYQLKA